MSNILVSISCITYNHVDYIKECLEGFLKQECNFGFEILIHDDASKDGTQDIIKEYQQKYPDLIFPILQVENQYSKGVRAISQKFNFPRSRGKYIAICEGDDYWTDPLKLQKQVDILESNQDYGMVHTQTKFVVVADGVIKDSLTNREDNSFENLVHKNNIATLTTLFRKDLIIKYIDEVRPSEQKHWVAGDLPVWLWFSLNSKIYYLDDVTSVYRVIAGSMSNTVTSEKYLSFIKSRFRIKEYFIINYNQSKELLQYIKMDFLNDAEFHAVKTGDTEVLKDIRDKYRSGNKLKYLFFAILVHNKHLYRFQVNIYRLLYKLFTPRREHQF